MERRLDWDVRLEVVETAELEEAADFVEAGVDVPGVEAGLRVL